MMNHRKVCELSSSWRATLSFSLSLFNKIFYELALLTLLELPRYLTISEWHLGPTKDGHDKQQVANRR